MQGKQQASARRCDNRIGAGAEATWICCRLTLGAAISRLGQLSAMGASSNIVRVGNASDEHMSRCFAGATNGMSQPGRNG